MSDHTIWRATVRDYEVDYQGIVNNANYFHYFEQARSVYLNGLGISAIGCSKQQINLVLLKAEILFHQSLVSGDSFYVVSTFFRSSRFKFVFKQELFRDSDQQRCTSALNLVAGIDANKKPCLLKELEALPIHHGSCD
ncbi:MAG: hypothetical protein A3J38_07500 [Gammaproteobacteria bacterium RIFCSPHIGHO2_12_FULL_45_9]|nr:MAG: hypothetical protein A3J38_07500 [Gammaproteobacteria bacterium RIFCSPHIGHO2_12_FULL_45_9]